MGCSSETDWVNIILAVIFMELYKSYYILLLSPENWTEYTMIRSRNGAVTTVKQKGDTRTTLAEVLASKIVAQTFEGNLQYMLIVYICSHRTDLFLFSKSLHYIQILCSNSIPFNYYIR